MHRVLMFTARAGSRTTRGKGGARRAGGGPSWDKTLGALPKAMASQAAWKIATWCMEIHGGHGYMKEFGVEKLVRDAAAFLHSDGVNRTLFLKAANFMFSD